MVIRPPHARAALATLLLSGALGLGCETAPEANGDPTQGGAAFPTADVTSDLNTQLQDATSAPDLWEDEDADEPGSDVPPTGPPDAGKTDGGPSIPIGAQTPGPCQNPAVSYTHLTLPTKA